MDKAGDDRAERLKAALRDNLRRRKVQARGRARDGEREPSPVEVEPRSSEKPGES